MSADAAAQLRGNADKLEDQLIAIHTEVDYATIVVDCATIASRSAGQSNPEERTTETSEEHSECSDSQEDFSESEIESDALDMFHVRFRSVYYQSSITPSRSVCKRASNKRASNSAAFPSVFLFICLAIVAFFSLSRYLSIYLSDCCTAFFSLRG